MPRVAKKATTKKTTTRKAKATAKEFLTLESIQMESSKFLGGILKSLDSQSNSLEKQLERVRKQFAKAQAKQKTAKDKRVAAVKKLKVKQTAANEKALDKAKATYDVAFSEASVLKNELEAIRTQLKETKQAQAHYNKLIKIIEKFEKSAAKAKASPKPKRATKAAGKTPAVKSKRGRKAKTATKEAVTEAAVDLFADIEVEEAVEA